MMFTLLQSIYEYILLIVVTFELSELYYLMQFHQYNSIY